MRRINYPRVVGGGLLAGVILAVGEYILNELLIADRWRAAMEDLGIEPPGTGAIVVYVIMMLVLGIALVWLYAVMRPRFGPGPGTALIAGLFTWFMIWVWAFGGSAVWGFFPLGMVAIIVVWGLVEVAVAAVAGAWQYRESDSLETGKYAM